MTHGPFGDTRRGSRLESIQEMHNMPWCLLVVLTCRYPRGACCDKLVLCVRQGIGQVRDGGQALGVDGRQAKRWSQDMETEHHVSRRLRRM